MDAEVGTDVDDEGGRKEGAGSRKKDGKRGVWEPGKERSSSASVAGSWPESWSE